MRQQSLLHRLACPGPGFSQQPRLLPQARNADGALFGRTQQRMCRRANDDQFVLDPGLSAEPALVAGSLDQTEVNIEPPDRRTYILSVADLHVDMRSGPLVSEARHDGGEEVVADGSAGADAQLNRPRCARPVRVDCKVTLDAHRIVQQGACARLQCSTRFVQQ